MCSGHAAVVTDPALPEKDWIQQLLMNVDVA